MLMALALVPGPWDLVHAQAPPSQTIRSADASDPAEVYVSARHSFRVVTVVEGLDLPWSMAWLPSGEMLVTERPGRLRIIRDGKLEPEPITGWPRVYKEQGQGGFMDVVPHPNFATNRLLYLSYGSLTRTARRERPPSSGGVSRVVMLKTWKRFSSQTHGATTTTISQDGWSSMTTATCS